MALRYLAASVAGGCQCQCQCQCHSVRLAKPEARRLSWNAFVCFGASLLALSVLVAPGPCLGQTIPISGKTYATRACQAPYDALPFCNSSLSVDERLSDLISRIWSNEQSVIPGLLTARNNMSSAIPTLGVPEYDWGLNCVHGVQSSCILLQDGTTRCPTSFMNPVNYGSAWNKSLSYQLGSIIGREARALWLAGAVEQSPRLHIGLNCWSPNINIARDPRWGRNQEVPSEDPLLNGDFGAQYTLGLQNGNDPHYVQVVVTLKHWDAYSLEDADGVTRHNFNAIISNYAMQTTYLPAFRESVKTGKAKGVMCAYNAINGVPACASPFLTKVLRDVWSFDGYVTSDSGAIEDFYTSHHYTPNALNSVPVALKDGQCDVCSGGVYQSSLLPALSQGLISREDIDLALRHTLKLRFELGLFDPADNQPYWNVPPTDIGTADSSSANLLACQSSMVLLKNTPTLLPISPGKKIAVIGPHGNATSALVGNYLGQLCPDNSGNCIVSPFLAITAANNGGAVTYSQGCEVTKNISGGVTHAVAAAQNADFVVLMLGIDDYVERESNDRTSIDLPDVQHELAQAVAAVGRPTVLVILHGGPVDISQEVANPIIAAIFDAGYPGISGGLVIAQTLFGSNDHLGGKLANTVYHADYVNEINMTDMEVDVGVGRSYRFYTGTPLFPFGYGLAFTNFSLTLKSGPPSAVLHTESNPSTILRYDVAVTNIGKEYGGDEVVQAYFSPLSTPSQPKSRLLKQLFAYERVHLQPGESTSVSFFVSTQTLRLVDRDTGDTVSTPGNFNILFTNGVEETLENMVSIEGEEVIVASYPY